MDRQVTWIWQVTMAGDLHMAGDYVIYNYIGSLQRQVFPPAKKGKLSASCSTFVKEGMTFDTFS